MEITTKGTMQQELPVFIAFDSISHEQFIAWYADHAKHVEKELLRVGAVFIQGVDIDQMEKFNRVMQAINPTRTHYLDGNSPRKKHTHNVYNASEYDASAKIHLHTEFSYSNLWPSRLFFCCTLPALTGGATPVADCRKVLASLPDDLVAEFEAKGIRYIRNLHNGYGFGPSWQEAFETESKTFLEQYCTQNGIAYRWQPDGSVRLVQTRPAIRCHPVTGERLWFNQVDQFYPSVYGKEIFEALMLMYDNDLEALPMHATFGDGTPIEGAYINQILQTLEEAEVRTPWEKGNLLIVDNMLALHGRMPFTGNRKVLVSMT